MKQEWFKDTKGNYPVVGSDIKTEDSNKIEEFSEGTNITSSGVIIGCKGINRYGEIHLNSVGRFTSHIIVGVGHKNEQDYIQVYMSYEELLLGLKKLIEEKILELANIDPFEDSTPPENISTSPGNTKTRDVENAKYSTLPEGTKMETTDKLVAKARIKRIKKWKTKK
jgi:hypothetical protein